MTSIPGRFMLSAGTGTLSVSAGISMPRELQVTASAVTSDSQPCDTEHVLSLSSVSDAALCRPFSRLLEKQITLSSLVCDRGQA